MATQRPNYSLVPETLKSFKVIGISTPKILEVKTTMLCDHGIEDSVAIVVFDAFRCSSTLLACFSSGLNGAMIMEKGIANRGTSIPKAKTVSAKLGFELVFGGELNGKPVPGGVVGNSPLEACSTAALKNCLLHFQSTNFGKVFVDMIDFAGRNNCKTDIYVISFANAETTAAIIRAAHHNRIFVVCGSFFDCISIEDMMLGGLLISNLGVSLEDLDDDSMAMLACHKTFSKQKGILDNCWIARVLRKLSKFEDIADIVGVSRIPQEHRSRMQNLILKVEYSDETPIVKSTMSYPSRQNFCQNL